MNERQTIDSHILGSEDALYFEQVFCKCGQELFGEDKLGYEPMCEECRKEEDE